MLPLIFRIAQLSVSWVAPPASSATHMELDDASGRWTWDDGTLITWE